MQGDLRCIEGRLLRHDPQHDDPELETDIGACPDCSGDGICEPCLEKALERQAERASEDAA